MITNSLAKKKVSTQKTFEIEGRFHHVSQVGLEHIINKQVYDTSFPWPPSTGLLLLSLLCF